MKGGGSLEFPSIHAWVQSCQQWCNEAQTSVQLLWNSINTRWNFHHYMSTSCVYRAKVKFPSTHDGNSIITCLCYVFIVQRSRFHQHMMECPSLHAYIMDNLNVQQRHWVTLRHWRASSDKTELHTRFHLMPDALPWNLEASNGRNLLHMPQSLGSLLHHRLQLPASFVNGFRFHATSAWVVNSPTVNCQLDNMSLFETNVEQD